MAACGNSVKIQRKQEPVTGLREAGQEGGAAAERLEPERPSWRRGQWPLWGASTPPPHAHAAVPGLRDPSPEPPPPPPALRPPLTGCSGIFSSDTAFKMAAPPPDNPLNRPLQQAPRPHRGAMPQAGRDTDRGPSAVSRATGQPSPNPRPFMERASAAARGSRAPPRA
ncbi:unnamed protein product [Rangifer tarandus platyrhynchus]|uniref:Uncharacterized protein n=1 Tax=Rangifer tarandus platyrhynchus TaxID=3082113 RepID=A0ABN9A209_RANTA|nr:unnamed protein product [Rangifer tarandus platyrhynchus]